MTSYRRGSELLDAYYRSLLLQLNAGSTQQWRNPQGGHLASSPGSGGQGTAAESTVASSVSMRSQSRRRRRSAVTHEGPVHLGNVASARTDGLALPPCPPTLLLPPTVVASVIHGAERRELLSLPGLASHTTGLHLELARPALSLRRVQPSTSSWRVPPLRRPSFLVAWPALRRDHPRTNANAPPRAAASRMHRGRRGL